MSTRASVVVKDGRDKLYFYQHSDGYPDGLGVSLDRFIQSEKAKSHIDDIEYFCGVLLIEINRDYIEQKTRLPDLVPALGIHGDESYTYIIDCRNLTIKIVHGAREE
jgi:hypothetical protein